MQPGELLRIARTRAGLSQKEFAERAGTSQPVISAYERGHRDPTTATLRRLTAATGHTLELHFRHENADGGVSPPKSVEEHGERLVDVLLLADAIGHGERVPLAFPRIDSAPGNSSV